MDEITAEVRSQKEEGRSQKSDGLGSRCEIESVTAPAISTKHHARTRSTAVVGTGYWGKNLVRVFDKLGALHIVCDSEPSRVRGLELSPEVRQCADLSDVLSDPAVDSVVVATPAATHFHICREALEAGKDVFVEKPLALEVEQGRELVRLAEERERILMVGHILRYHPAILKLQEMIYSGQLGRVEYIYSNRLNMGKLRTEENILWSFAPHDISVVLALLGEQPLSVSSHGEAFLQRNVSDVTLTSIEFANNVKAHTFVSWLHPFKEQRLVVVGSEQMVVFEDSNPSEKLVAYPHKVEWHAGKIPVAVKGERRVVEISSDEPLKVECEHFLDCCLNRIPARTDGHEGLAVLRVLAAAEVSLKAGGKVVNVAPAGGNGNGRGMRTQVKVQSAECKVQDEDRSPVSTHDARACYVHPTAIVDQGAEIGEGTKVWHWSHVSKGTRIGRNNVLGQNVFVADNVRTGDNCKVQNNVSLYKGVVIEDDVFCGPSCVFTNVIDPRAFIEKKSEFRDTLVKCGASIGANATVVCGNTLGRYCLVGSGAVVTRDVPDYALVTGVPARRTGWVCKCGARLNFGQTKAEGRRQEAEGRSEEGGRYTACKCGNEYELCGVTVRPVREE
jgi:UDP-2-acetamido-3-amino-2,3-dideoxy-glucuronate N-acetyltransferase